MAKLLKRESALYDICPYCLDPMGIRFEMPDRNLTSVGYRYYHYLPKLFFECRVCKSRSPVIELDEKCINISEVKKIMNDSIIELDEMEVSDND